LSQQLAQPRLRQFFAALFAVTLILRLCHAHLLWPDEDYHLAAAIQLLHGKMLYRDLWYDKPPLSALTYALIGAPTGWALRLFDSVWILAICLVAFRVAREMWSDREALIASGLIAFFLNFDLPGGIIPIAPDFFMVLPHLLAMWCAWKEKPLAAGGWCGIAFLFNPKGAFLLAACAIVLWRSLPLLLLGFLIPNAAAIATLLLQGAAAAYIEQVWKWGLLYAKSPPASASTGDALRRTVDWLGFHAALVLGCAWCWWKERTRATRFLAIWAFASLLAVAAGSRFSSRYFLQLLPVLAMAAARGAVLAFSATSRPRVIAAIAAIVLLVPLVRFGPRYALLARDLLKSRETRWTDAALDRDSRAVSDWLRSHQRAGDTLFVWGYRPDVFAYTRMPAASVYWDSQPLTGVPADRHLSESLSLIPQWAAANRRELAASHPAFVVDGLSLLNPRLAMDEFPVTKAWLGAYQLVQRTALSLIYERAR
jgi:4-amino-4-deoxy-L-arabinose transferase-like glycosyltransferase